MIGRRVSVCVRVRSSQSHTQTHARTHSVFVEPSATVVNKLLSYYFIWIYYKNNADVYTKSCICIWREIRLLFLFSTSVHAAAVVAATATTTVAASEEMMKMKRRSSEIKQQIRRKNEEMFLHWQICDLNWNKISGRVERIWDWTLKPLGMACTRCAIVRTMYELRFQCSTWL